MWWNDITSTPGIYRIVNMRNGKVYIGSTKNLKERCSEHFRHLKKGDHVNAHWLSAYNLYGHDSFRYGVLEHVCDENDLLVREQHYMDLLKPEYNIALFAGAPTRGRKLSPDSIARGIATRKARREQDPSYGAHIVSDELKEKFSAMYTGKKLPPRSPEWIEKNAAANRGRKTSPAAKAKQRAAKLGKKQSPEHAEKRASAHRGKKQSPEHIEKRFAKRRANKPPLF